MNYRQNSGVKKQTQRSSSSQPAILKGMKGAMLMAKLNMNIWNIGRVDKGLMLDKPSFQAIDEP